MIYLASLPTTSAPLLLAIFASLHTSTAALAQTPASADDVLAQIRERSKVPGLAAAVVRDGRIVAAGTSGLRAIDGPNAVQLSDSFVIGSCTKPMTRLLLGRLAQAGALKLDATLSQLLPGMKMRPEYDKVTLADLIAHTAGLPAYTRITPQDTPIVFQLKGSPTEQRKQFVEHVLLEPPVGTVGKDFAYSNAGFAVLGHILERAAGKPWEILIHDEVFQPLGMKTATIGFPQELPANARPQGHDRSPAGFVLATYSPPSVGFLAPAGGVCLSIEDFARFAAAEANVDAGRDTPFLRKEFAAALPNLLPPSMRQGPSVVLHGGQGTFTAACGIWPAENVGIVVTVNGGNADDVCDAAVDALRAAFVPDIPPTAPPGSGPKLGVMLRAEADGPVVIESVVAGGLADHLGLKAGDEIVSLNGTPLKAGEPNALGAALRVPGVKITLRRAGATFEVQTPAGAPAESPARK